MADCITYARLPGRGKGAAQRGRIGRGQSLADNAADIVLAHDRRVEAMAHCRQIPEFSDSS